MDRIKESFESFKYIILHSLKATKNNILKEEKKAISTNRKISINSYIEYFERYNVEILSKFFEKNKDFKVVNGKIILSVFVFSDQYSKLKEGKSKRRTVGIQYSDLFDTLNLSYITPLEEWKINNCYYFGKDKKYEISWKKKETGLSNCLLSTKNYINEPFIGSVNEDIPYLKNEFLTRILWYNEIKVDTQKNSNEKLPNFQINVYVTEKKIFGYDFSEDGIKLAKNNIYYRLYEQKKSEIINEINKISDCYLNSDFTVDKSNTIYKKNIYKNREKEGTIPLDQTRIEYKCKCEKNPKSCSKNMTKYYKKICKSENILSERFKKVLWQKVKNKEWDSRDLSCEEKVDYFLHDRIGDVWYKLKVSEEEIQNSFTCIKKEENKKKIVGKIVNFLIKPVYNTRNMMISRKFGISVALLQIGTFLWKNRKKIVEIISIVKPVVSWFLLEGEERSAKIATIISSPKALFVMNEMIDQSKTKSIEVITISKYATLLYQIYKRVKGRQMFLILSSEKLSKVKDSINKAINEKKVIIYFNIEDFKNVDTVLNIMKKFINNLVEKDVYNLGAKKLLDKTTKTALNTVFPVIWNIN